MHPMTVKLLRYFAALVLLAVNAVTMAAAPQVNTISGSVMDGQTVTLSGVNFTAKENAKPLLFWSADTGILPSNLGRKTAWDNSAFGGVIVDKATNGAVVADGSTKVLRYDYETSEGAILSRVHFDSDSLYVWRKRYDDFDRLKDFAIRTRYTNIQSIKNTKSIFAGMLMSTVDKKLWGKVIKSTPNSDGVSGTVFYSNKIGNLTNYDATRVVTNGSLLYFYDENDTSLSAPLLSVNLNEGAGIFQSFNHKIFRLWGEYGVAPNNTHVSLDWDARVTNELTQVSSFLIHDWDHPLYSATKRWVVEEFDYAAGSIDGIDGMFNYWQDRVRGWKNQKFRMRTSQYPRKYSDLYQGQVSNGAQPLSYEYFDALYVDDTWHRVQVCSESKWSNCKQPELIIPSAWSDTQITGKLRLGALKNKSSFYIYVTNGQGEVNEMGYPSCPLCPLPPAQK